MIQVGSNRRHAAERPNGDGNPARDR